MAQPFLIFRSAAMKYIFLIAFASACFATQAFAQSDYTPTTTWPYVYPDFESGTLAFSNGREKAGKFNVSYADNMLYFIDGELVKIANIYDVASVKIGNDYYANVQGKMLKVLEKNDHCLIVRETTIDMTQLNETGGAYGSSSVTTGTMALSSIDGSNGSFSNVNHMELLKNKDNGKILPLVGKNYIFVKGQKILCTKGGFIDALGDKGSEGKDFLKKNKIKWRNPVSALAAGDFLYNEL